MEPLSSAGRIGATLAFLEGYIHQQPVAFHRNHVAEGSLTIAGEVERNATVPDLHIADLQVIEPIR